MEIATPLKDRIDAGRRLAIRLSKYCNIDALVLAIPRGGVVIGYQVARELKADLDIIVPRKIGAPYNPELAIGAVAEDGSIAINHQLIKNLGVEQDYLSKEIDQQINEIKRRVRLYRAQLPPLQVKGRKVILVDDGLATGYTMRVAVMSVRRSEASLITVAVPVAPPDSIVELKRDVEEIVCLYTPEPFFAISQFYLDFRQISDEEVVDLLTRARK